MTATSIRLTFVIFGCLQLTGAFNGVLCAQQVAVLNERTSTPTGSPTLKPNAERTAKHRPPPSATTATDQVAVTIGLRNIEAGLDWVTALFDLIDRPDLQDFLAWQLSVVGDLQGVDRQRPVAISFGVSEELFPIRNPILCVPIDDVSLFTTTLQLAGWRVRPSGRQPGVFRLLPSRGVITYMTVSHGYAFIGLNLDLGDRLFGRTRWISGRNAHEFDNGTLFTGMKVEHVDRAFSDPAESWSELATRYDAWLHLDWTELSPASRRNIEAILREAAKTSIQQRDRESDSAYETRRIQADARLYLATSLLRDGESITIGCRNADTEHVLDCDVILKARPGTLLAEELANWNSLPGEFAGEIRTDAIWTWLASARLSEFTSSFVTVTFDTIVDLLCDASMQVEDPQNSVNTLVRLVNESAQDNRISGFMQCLRVPENEKAIVGGMRLARQPLHKRATIVRNTDAVLTTGVSNGGPRSGLILRQHHSLLPSIKRTRGSVPTTHAAQFFTSEIDDVVWFGLGPPHAAAELTSMIALRKKSSNSDSERGSDRNRLGNAIDPRPRPGVAMEFVTRLRNWLPVKHHVENAARTEKDRSSRFVNTFDEADIPDRLSIEFRSVGETLKMTARFEEAFLRSWGNAIARSIDNAHSL